MVQARWNDLGEWQEFKVYPSSGDDEVLSHGHSVHLDAYIFYLIVCNDVHFFDSFVMSHVD